MTLTLKYYCHPNSFSFSTLLLYDCVTLLDCKTLCVSLLLSGSRLCPPLFPSLITLFRCFPSSESASIFFSFLPLFFFSLSFFFLSLTLSSAESDSEPLVHLHLLFISLFSPPPPSLPSLYLSAPVLSQAGTPLPNDLDR